MYITITKALYIAVDAIKQLPDTYENRQAIIRLTNLQNTKFTKTWTKEDVFKQLNKWKQSHKRNPTVTDLAEPDMPKATTIKRLFDMDASAFLNTYYPTKHRKPNVTAYTIKQREEWIFDFKLEFERIKPKSGKEYDACRKEGTPTWETIARNLGITRWRELLELSGVDYKKTVTNLFVASK